MTRTLVLALAALACAAPAAAQVMLGAGRGVTLSGPTSGAAWHAQASVPFARGRGPLLPRGEVYALAQHGTAIGSPPACVQVRQFYCLGREDRNTFVGAGVALVLEGWLAGGGLQPYLRFGSGLYHQRVESTEFEGPTATCVRNKEFVPCPDNPPFGSFSHTTSRTGPGITAAFGLRFRALGVGGFAEVGSHAALVDGESAGAAPITLGFSL